MWIQEVAVQVALGYHYTTLEHDACAWSHWALRKVSKGKHLVEETVGGKQLKQPQCNRRSSRSESINGKALKGKPRDRDPYFLGL